MKMKITENLLLLFTFGLLTINCTFYQFDSGKPATKIYKGYVIKESGDTIYGKLQMLSPTMNQVKVKFISKNGKRITYKAKEIQSYGFQAEIWNKKEKRNIQKWVYYTKMTVERPPIPFAGNDILMQQEVKGSISMYNYYIETRSNQNMEHIVYLGKEGVLYKIDKENYRKILKSLMADFPVVYHKIGTKGYTHKFLDKTIAEYNQQASKKGDVMMSYDMD